MSDVSRSRRVARVSAALLLCVPIGTALAQTGGIAGKVTDRATQLPLASVRVIVAGTALETQTNKDGEYRLTNVRPGRVHVGALHLGYRASYDSATVASGQTATIDFTMEPSLVTLSDVVVTGTAGNQERRAQSAQVATLPAAQVQQDATISTVGELLQSRVTGVAVNSASGSVGAARQIRIRGASSINLSNNPLIFIDGIRVTDGVVDLAAGGQGSDRLNDLNPDDIESIEVVKGPAAATLYGADASAGVIQIMTKKGRPGSNRFSQTVRLEGGSLDQHWTPPDNYGNCTAALVAATSTNPLCRGQAVGTLVHDNPLVRTGAFRNGTDRTIGWSGRGGGQNYGYNLSVGTENASGTLPDNGFERYNLRSNFDWVPNSQVTFDFGLGLIQAKTFLPQNDNNIFGFLGGALLGSPLTRRDDGNPGQDGWFGFNRHVDAITAIEGSILTHRTTVTVSANYLPVAWFSNKFTVGGDELRDEQTSYFPKNTNTWYAGDLNLGNNVQTRRGLSRYTIDYLGNLRGLFGSESQWEGNLSFGLQAIVSRVDSISATGQGFVTNANNVIAAASTTTGSGGYTQQDQYGYLTQAQLGYRNRFFLQAGVRVDKFSSFGAKVPAFVLPKFGASWVISEERFFQPLTGVFGSFRLRGAWGTTGRTPGPGASLTTLAAAPYNLTGSNSAGAIPNNPGNPNLKAERGIEYEAGFDGTLWHDRLSFDVGYFNKQTKDLILARPQPPSLGFQQNPLQNIGAVVNRGIEAAVTASILRTSPLQWDVRVGVNTLHNELTDLGGIAPFFVGQSNYVMKGQQLGVFVTNRIRSIDVAKSKVIVSDTLEPAGNLFPTLEWNLTNTWTVLKDFRVVAALDSKRDFSVFNFSDFFRETQLRRSNRRLDPTVLSRYEFLRRYGSDLPGAASPFVRENGTGATVNEVQEAYIQPGDFTRFRELSVTYNVPARFLNSIGRGVQAASIGLAMQNIKLWTNYQGADPEVVGDVARVGGLFSRFDFFTLPNPQKTVLRFNVTF